MNAYGDYTYIGDSLSNIEDILYECLPKLVSDNLDLLTRQKFLIDGIEID
jgi:hypothetical protein